MKWIKSHEITFPWTNKILTIQDYWPPGTWMIQKYWFYNCCIEFLNCWTYLSTPLKFNTFSIGCVSWRTQSSEICRVCVLSIFSRELAMQEGIQTAIQVPVTVSRIANQLWPTIKELAKVCNINCKSDLQVRWFQECFFSTIFIKFVHWNSGSMGQYTCMYIKSAAVVFDINIISANFWN